METLFCTLTGGPGDEEIYRRAGEIIRAGGLVAFPTYTVYGLGGNGLNAASSAKIYAAKGRPSDNPLILHIADIAELAPLVQEIPAAAKHLADAFWPGPMTLIFRKSSIVPDETTGGLDTVGIRVPSHKAMHRIIELSGCAIAAPSANTSGLPSPTSAEHVMRDMNGRIAAVVDGGQSEFGVESTVISFDGADAVRILRPGAVTREMLLEVCGEVVIDPAILHEVDAGAKVASPGMKYKHYSPKADIIMVEAAMDDFTALVGENYNL